MSLHVFGAILSHHGTAANNRGETEGNITTLQKLLWMGKVHTTVSAESIRFALRRRLGEHEKTNRRWDEEFRSNVWEDAEFKAWSKPDADVYIDDDLLGFMSADAAKEEAEPDAANLAEGEKPKKTRAKGTAKVRRAVLEVTRAVSLTPFAGDITFNAASPGATPSAQKKGSNPVPYGTELHATRYQYGFALTPGALRKPQRAATAISCLAALGQVAGNHGRFLYDFSPESAIFRVTHDPAPRILYIFEQHKDSIEVPALLDRVKSGDVPGRELILAGSITQSQIVAEFASFGATIEPGVRKAAELVCARIAAGEG